MMSKVFYVDKTTSTFADELLAAGFIYLLDQLFYQQGQRQPDIVQTDRGAYYEITTAAPLDLSRVDTETHFFPVAPIIRTAKNKKKLPDLPENTQYVVDYDDEREKRGAFLTAFKELEKTAKRAYITGDDDNFPFEAMPQPPHAHWNIFRLLNPAALIGYNNLMVQWYEIGEAGKSGLVCRLACELFSQSPNNLETAVTAWKPVAKEHGWSADATASQFFNPSQGKGINKPLPNGVGLGNMKEFWLLEWLKMVGFYQIAITNTLKGVKDRKTYVPAVGRADLISRQRVQTIFRSKMRFAETAVLSDILTVIRYVMALMERVETAQSGTANAAEHAFLALLGDEVKRPADFVRGFHTVFYKDLGNAVTTMNISFLNLPGWIEIHRREDVAIFQEILEEHQGIVRQFAENRGEELDLLNLYRDFIVADNIDPFFEFTTAYSSWLISQGEKPGFPPKKLSIHNLRRMLMSIQPNLSEILETPGFINIARAIRESTVRAQYRKNQKNDKRYTVRYGLGRDLVRQSQYPEEFIAALSEFLLAYNAENAQVLERYPKDRYPHYKYRWDVQTSDIEEIVQLIDKYKNSNLIAKLLVAYGYASEYRARQEQENN